MNFRRTLVKYTAALSVFFAGISAINVPSTVHADDVENTTVTTNNSISDLETTNTKKRNAVVKLVKKQIGKPYIYGAAGPSGFDCSGLTSYVYKNAINKILPRTTYGQITLGKTISVSTKKLKKGDLLFWGNYHVGIYVGNGKFVHAPAPGQNVKQQTLASFYPSSAKRVID